MSMSCLPRYLSAIPIRLTSYKQMGVTTTKSRRVGCLSNGSWCREASYLPVVLLVYFHSPQVY